jgi:hypothetical protein
MQTMWSYLGYDNNESPYIVKGTLYRNNDETIASQYVISMEYDNYKYSLTMDIDKSLTPIFISYFIRNIKKMITNELDSFVLDGETNLKTEFCSLYKKDNQYYITHLKDNLDNWIIKFDNNFGEKLLDVLTNMLKEVQL